MLHETIKKLRVSHGLNQVEFGKLLGVTKQCVSNWENDNVIPSVEMLIRMADLFHVSIDFILGRSEKKLLDVSELTEEQIAHLSLIITDLSQRNS